MAQGPGEARHEIAAAPGPQNRTRRHPLQASRRRSSTAPPNPETPQAHATHSNFGFPRIPKTTGPKRGSESHVPVWVSGGLGLQVKDQGAPAWHYFNLKTRWIDGLVRPVARHTGAPSTAGIPSLTAIEIAAPFRAANSYERGCGMPDAVDRVQRWDLTILVNFSTRKINPL